MLVSSKWIQDYVNLPIELDELTSRLSMSGVNHEGTEAVGDDFAIDLEVTNNRPDWLGHIGVAREISVLLDEPLQFAQPQPPADGPKIESITKVQIQCPELCTRYSARVIQGVKVGPSPAWLVERLQAIGEPTINSIVDITNFVLLECGQPLHAFDLAKLSGPEIIVREAVKGESFQAIDHKKYELASGMCVIADTTDPVAIGGVMGGEGSEVSEETTDVLIEAANFAPLSIRNTARKLKLHSSSSYRFERTVDPEMIDWASRRACQLILEIAGGKLAQGVIDIGDSVGEREVVELRYAQVPRVLGIDVPHDKIRQILTKLGCSEIDSSDTCLRVRPPSWRRDLTREIDLIEEVARVHGYEQIPESTNVAMAVSIRSDADRTLELVRRIMTAQGFDEALTRSMVGESDNGLFSPWSDTDALSTFMPMVKGESHIRRSIVPSLLGARRANESMGNRSSELFETACVFLNRPDQLPLEQRTLGVVSGRSFFELKGIIELLASESAPGVATQVRPLESAELIEPGRSCEILLDGQRLAIVGEVNSAAAKQTKLRSFATVAELNLELLFEVAKPLRTHSALSPYPAIERDLNIVLDESVRWASLQDLVHDAAGDCLEQLNYLDTYRDPEADGANKKRLLFRVVFRSTDRTLTNEEADAFRDQIVERLGSELGGRLLA